MNSLQLFLAGLGGCALFLIALALMTGQATAEQTTTKLQLGECTVYTVVFDGRRISASPNCHVTQ